MTVARRLFSTAMVLMAAAAVSCTPKTFKFTFDGGKEMSGVKFALKDINPDLPANWDDFNYVVLEYKIGTAQRFQVGFTTDYGYNELRIMNYVPNAWNRLAIPLSYFERIPDASLDLATTFNHPRYTGWVNLGGNRNPMHGVDSIGFRMRRAIGNPSIELRNVTLSVEDPGDAYLENTPAIDEFGQHAMVDYPEKVSSLEELKSYWEKEEESYGDGAAAYGYSKFGGYQKAQVEGTGYFRVEQIDGKWWFVDPEGYLFLSVGIDCVGAGHGGHVRDYDKRANMYAQMPPEGIRSFGEWNLYRRYGEDYMQKANDFIIKRMDAWGLNTIANWSDYEVMKMNRKAFIIPLGNLGMASELMGLADIYDPEYSERMENSIKSIVEKNQFRGNPWLIGYFIGNEPAWINEESLLCDRILAGKDGGLKDALKAFLEKNGDNAANRRSFILKTFKKFLEDSNRVLKKYDPEHLNLGIRFGDPDGLGEDLLSVCGDVFDVFSFNCYTICPDSEMVERAARITGLPMIIGEYHFGTVDRGLAQSLWQVENQQQRGVAYRYYTEQAYSHPALIGTGYFQWCDQDMTGRFDGENYNCGLIDVTDRPYAEQVEAMSETAKVLYEVHLGIKEPFAEQPRNARGHGAVPDLWN